MHTYPVEFKEDAGAGFVVVKVVFLDAGLPVFHVHVAHLSLAWRTVVVAVVDVLAAARRQPGLPVHYKMPCLDLAISRKSE